MAQDRARLVEIDRSSFVSSTSEATEGMLQKKKVLLLDTTGYSALQGDTESD